MKKYIIGFVILVVIVVAALEFGGNDEVVTKISNNEYQISLIAENIVINDGVKQLSADDMKSHSAEITSRMNDANLCTSGFTINGMSLMNNRLGGLKGQLAKNINIVNYSISCK